MWKISLALNLMNVKFHSFFLLLFQTSLVWNRTTNRNSFSNSSGSTHFIATINKSFRNTHVNRLNNIYQHTPLKCDEDKCVKCKIVGFISCQTIRSRHQKHRKFSFFFFVREFSILNGNIDESCISTGSHLST